MLRPWLFLVLGATLGCGSSSSGGEPDAGDPGDDGGDDGGTDAGPDSTRLSCEGASGERLRQVVRQHGDGSSQFVRLHDTDFAESCAFAPASDGALRCLPAVDGAPFAAGEVRYSDPECATAIGQLAALIGDPPPSHMSATPPAGACGPSPPTFHVLGDKLAIVPDATIYQLVGETCTAVLAPATDFFAITELPADSFVEGTETFTDSGRLAVAQVDGADGSRFCRAQGQLLDRDLADHPCRLELSEDGSLRCLPGDASASQLFTDDVCTLEIEVARVDEACQPDAAYLRDGAGAQCPQRQRVRALAGPVKDPLFDATAKGCLAVAAGPVALGIGATVSSFSFAELGPSFSPSGDRLERADLVTGDGLRLFRGDWFDSQLKQLCRFAPAADGTERCLPLEGPLELVARTAVVYTDEICTAQIELGGRDASCAGGAPTFVLDAIGGGRTRVHEVGPAHPGPLYELGTACVEVPATEVFYELGAEVLAQSFVGGTEIIE